MICIGKFMRFNWNFSTLGAIAIALIAQPSLAQPLLLEPHNSDNVLEHTNNDGRVGNLSPSAIYTGNKDDLSTPTGQCVGKYHQDSDYTLSVFGSKKAKVRNLRLEVESDRDTTLMVNGPGGLWCNDDDEGDPDPMIYGEWLPGSYRIWVGSYQPGQRLDYTIRVTDLGN
jgi:hypothetical protein